MITVQSVVVHERVMPMPSFVEAGAGQDAVSIERPGGVFLDNDHILDDEGTKYQVLACHDIANNNITWAEVYKRKKGEPFPSAPFARINPVHKIDNVSMDHDGTTLTFSLGTHTPITGQDRHIFLEEAPPVEAGFVQLATGGGRPLPEPETVPRFSDMDNTSPFFVAVQVLSQIAAIGGYSDGTFKPNNWPSRGQVCKIIYNTLKWKEGR